MDGTYFLVVPKSALILVTQAPELFKAEDEEGNEENSSVGENQSEYTRTTQTDVYALGMVRLIYSFVDRVSEFRITDHASKSNAYGSYTCCLRMYRKSSRVPCPTPSTEPTSAYTVQSTGNSHRDSH